MYKTSVFILFIAGVAQLVEHHVANVKVAGSSPVSRSLALKKARRTEMSKVYPASLLFIGFLILGSIANTRCADANRLDPSKITQITYRFDDASVPPPYHKSYTITISREKISMAVDSYGKILSSSSHAMTEDGFSEIASALNQYGIKKVRKKESMGCTGGEGIGIEITTGKSAPMSLYRYMCGGKIYGDMGGNPEGVLDAIKKYLPDFSSLLSAPYTEE